MVSGPGGHHLTSLLLHAAASVVLFLALRRLTGAVWRSGSWPLSSAFTRCTSSRWRGLPNGRTCSAAFSWPHAVGLCGLCAVAVFLGPLLRRRRALRPGLLCKPMLVTAAVCAPAAGLLAAGKSSREQGAGGGDSRGAGRGEQGAGSGERGAGAGRAEQGAGTARQAENLSYGRLVVEKLPLLALSAASCTVTYLVQPARKRSAKRRLAGFRVQTSLLAYAELPGQRCSGRRTGPDVSTDREPNSRPWWLCSLVLLGISLAVLFVAVIARCERVCPTWLGWLWYLGHAAAGMRTRLDR